MADTPRIARRGPFPVEVKAGKTYWWCACGLSARQPFCDGSHKGAGIEPVAYVAERNGALWLCGCKATRTQPLCDGSHKTL